jgi:hypothetical protein
MLEKIKNLKWFDFIILALIILALGVGFFTYKKVRATADKQIEATSRIGFQVFLRGVTITSPTNPLKKGEKTFVTIRNVPYTELEILDVKADARKAILPSGKPNEQFTLVDDYSQIFLYDMVVSIVDTAKITKDGAVVGGNKIKIGLPITLEGKDYKLTGLVSDIQVLPETKSVDKTLDNQLNMTKDVQ